MKALREIEEQANQALNSLENLQPLEANQYLYTKIKNRMLQSRQAAQHIRLMFRLSAALLVFVCLNITSIYVFNTWQDKQNTNTPAKAKTGINALSDEFFPSTNTYNY
jgi:hypothetical protein